MAEPKLIKVCLTNKGEDTETPWAHDLGPAPGPAGSRKVKLVNVPFMHAKPTWGDTIVVSPVSDGFPTWDRDGAPWKQISTRIVDDGGRWAMIVDYHPRDISAEDALRALSTACDTERVVCEGAWGPRDAEPGRVYLAVQRELTAEDVMDKLLAASLPVDLIQVHPEPKKRPRAATQIGITPEPRKPAAANGRTETAKPTPPAAASAAPAPPRRESAPALVPPMNTPRNDVPAGTPATSAAAPAKPATVAATPPKAAAAKPTPATSATAPAKPATAAAPTPKAAAAKPTPAKAIAPAKATAPAKAASKPAAKAASKPAAKPAAKPAKPAKAAAKPAKAAAKPAKPAKPAAKPAKSAKPAAKKPAAKKR